MLHVPQRVRSHRRPAADEVEYPLVAQQRGPAAAGAGLHVTAPVPGWLGPCLSHERVEHEIEQVVLVVDVPVQRHRARAQFPGDPPHADRVGALGVSDRDGGPHDLVP